LKTIRKWLKVALAVVISIILGFTGGYALVKFTAFCKLAFEGVILRDQNVLWVWCGFLIMVGSFCLIVDQFLADDPDFD